MWRIHDRQQLMWVPHLMYISSVGKIPWLLSVIDEAQRGHTVCPRQQPARSDLLPWPPKVLVSRVDLVELGFAGPSCVRRVVAHCYLLTL